MRIWPIILFLLGLGGLAFGVDKEGAMTLSIPKDVARTAPGVPKVDRIWSAVIVATNPDTPKAPPSELREMEGRLKHMFGYTQFELAGSATEEIDEPGSATEEIDELTENWLLPSPIFPLSVTARRATSKEARGGYLLNLKIFQQNRQVCDSEVKLAPDSPLFIRGPLYGKGQIIIVLKVQH
jgi:hypothetical protein